MVESLCRSTLAGEPRERAGRGKYGAPTAEPTALRTSQHNSQPSGLSSTGPMHVTAWAPTEFVTIESYRYEVRNDRKLSLRTS